MFIKVEPAGFFMYTVQMAFDLENPDSEDNLVKDYLTGHELEPRYQWEADLDGRNCQWFQFGGCYLGNHLQGIGQIQRNAVEVELLTEEINRRLDSNPQQTAALTEESRQNLITSLVTELHQPEIFAPNEEGLLAVNLDQQGLCDAIQRFLKT